MNLVRLLVAAVFAIGLCLGPASDNSYGSVSSVEKPASTAEKADKKTDNKPQKKELARASIDINKAAKEDLEMLPGVGPVTAEAILQYRKANGNFKTVEDLTGVKGIGDKTLAKIKPYLKKI